MSRDFKRLVVDLDTPAYEMLEQVRAAIVQRNLDRSQKLEFDQYERATYRAIVERGIARIHRELVDVI